MATRLLEIEATWDCGHVATWLRTLAVEGLRVASPLMRLLDDVSEIYKLVAYIPVMFLNPFLEERLQFMRHNI